MKKQLLLFAAALVSLSASAQYYPDGRPIPPRKRGSYYGNRYGNDRQTYDWGLRDTYYGFRLGMAIASVHSDAPLLDGSDPRVGLDVGFVVGTRIVPTAPLYFETGLSYVEKGGKGDVTVSDVVGGGKSKFTYSLDYLELPLLLKYKALVAPGVTVEPAIGGYLAIGVGGKIKDFGEREAYSSFGSDKASFRRFDGGLRLGCGLSYNMLSVGLSYDIGLANVGHYDFEDTHTGSLNLNVGVTF